VIYTDQLLAFEIVSMILTVGVLGAIVLALPERLGVRSYKRRDTISLAHPSGTDLVLPEGTTSPSGTESAGTSVAQPAGVGRRLVFARDPDEQPVTGGGRK
jgi:hypothetical protein